MNVSFLEWIEMPTYKKINNAHGKILMEAVDFSLCCDTKVLPSHKTNPSVKQNVSRDGIAGSCHRLLVEANSVLGAH